jgi:hypothetical protein
MLFREHSFGTCSGRRSEGCWSNPHGHWSWYPIEAFADGSPPWTPPWAADGIQLRRIPMVPSTENFLGCCWHPLAAPSVGSPLQKSHWATARTVSPLWSCFIYLVFFWRGRTQPSIANHMLGFTWTAIIISKVYLINKAAYLQSSQMKLLFLISRYSDVAC